MEDSNVNQGVPNQVKCGVCQVNRMKSAFSNRQLMEWLASTKRQHVGGATLPRCRQCVGSQNVEMTCVICGITKDLGQFSKTQKKNRDEKRCIQCVQYHLDVEPNLDDARYEDEIENQSSHGSQSCSNNGSALNSSIKTQHCRPGDSSMSNMSTTSSRDGVPLADEEAGVWTERPTVSNRFATSASRGSGPPTLPLTNTLWDQFTAATGEVRTYRASTTNNVAGSTTSNTGWAKSKAPKPTEAEKKNLRDKYDERDADNEQRSLEDSEDDDDDGKGDFQEYL